MAGTDSGEPPSGTACRDERSPLILAHRGASGARPENSLEAFRLAVEWGADYIELDVVMSGDGVLMCLHDTDLVGTTDVRTKFPNRWARNAKGAPVDAEGNPVGFGRRVWLPKDFTREELHVPAFARALRHRGNSPQGQPWLRRPGGDDPDLRGML